MGKRHVYKSFVIGRAFRDGHLGTMAGQVPRRDMDIDRKALDRLVSQKPPPWSADRMLARPVFSTRGAVADLGLDPAVEGEWSRFLQKAVYNSPREFQMRQQVMERLTREDWAPELRKTIFQRAVSLYRNSMTKSLAIYTPDELAKARKEPQQKLIIPKDKDADAEAEAKKKAAKRAKGGKLDPKRIRGTKTEQKPGKKAAIRATIKPDKKLKPVDVRGKSRPTKGPSKGAKPDPKAKAASKAEQKPVAKQSKGRDPRGGTFYRRVPHESGKGHRYYYDPEKYHARKDAHVSGEDMQRQAMGKGITKMLDKAGEGGCAVSDLKEMVKKYGSKEVGSHLQNDCGPGGGAMFANGRFYRRRGASPEKKA